MPFGKYKGIPVADLPRKYLLWLNRTADLYGDLAVAVDCAIKGKPVPQAVNEDDVLNQIVGTFEVETKKPHDE